MASKLIRAEHLIKAMMEAGLLPEDTVAFEIRARVGELVELHYECLGDARLEAVLVACVVADEPSEAVAT